jgi:hypothetical protein
VSGGRWGISGAIDAADDRTRAVRCFQRILMHDIEYGEIPQASSHGEDPFNN